MLMEKLRRLNHYHQEKGLVETIKEITHKAYRVITTDKYLFRRQYPFEYLYPPAITIEIMNICNLKCRHCYRQFQSHSDIGFMDYDFFKKIITKLSPLINKAKQVNFLSVEALFHPRIFEMIDFIFEQNRDVTIDINTNGMLLTDDRISNLVKRKIYNINISLDGCNKETIESFKTGVDFESVVYNIKNLKKRGNAAVCIGTIFVAHKGNIDEVMDYIDFCKILGISVINITGFLPYTLQMADCCLYSEVGIKKIDELFLKAKQKAENLGMRILIRGTKIKPGGCVAAHTMYIDKYANVVPCVSLGRKTPMVLCGRTSMSEQVIWGNILKDEPYKIWTSKASVDFRRLLYDKKLPRECALCAIGQSVII